MLPMSYMENTEVVRALSFWVKKIPKYAGEGKRFPSISQFVTEAIKEKIERLENKK